MAGRQAGARAGEQAGVGMQARLGIQGQASANKGKQPQACARLRGHPSQVRRTVDKVGELRRSHTIAHLPPALSVQLAGFPCCFCTGIRSVSFCMCHRVLLQSGLGSDCHAVLTNCSTSRLWNIFGFGGSARISPGVLAALHGLPDMLVHSRDVFQAPCEGSVAWYLPKMVCPTSRSL